MRLTDISIRSLKSPERGEKIYYDDTLTGFGIRVSEGGTKSFVLTHGIRRQRETLGRFGILSLHEARTEAKRRLAEYILGKAEPIPIEWDEAIQEYLDECELELKPTTIKCYTYHLKKHFRFGQTKLADLEPADFVRKLNKLTDRRSEHRHAFAVLHSFVEWAYQKHYFEKHPLERMETPHPTRSRNRVLTRIELEVVFRMAMAGKRHFDKIVALLILTGQRRTQIGAIHEDWLSDSGYIVIPPEFTKHTEHLFPIGQMTRDVIERDRPKSPYLFPAARERRRGQTSTVYNGWGTSKTAFDKQLAKAGHKVAPWTLHDLRRTFRTNWAQLGVPREVAEKYIHHISGVHSGVNAIYDRHDYLAEMKAAVEKWEHYLQSLVA
jgi:site-specific recombinase XerD